MRRSAWTLVSLFVVAVLAIFIARTADACERPFEICTYFTGLEHGQVDDVFDACIEVLAAADAVGLYPPMGDRLAVSLAWRESRLDRTLVSTAGAVGLMQVKVQYHCPDDACCDLTYAGAFHAVELMSEFPTMSEALAHYNCGNVATDPCFDFAADVRSIMTGLRHHLDTVCE